jgi:hypothetical protein
MPLSYRIYPDLGLVYVRYEGFIEPAETQRGFIQYMQDPQFRPGQKQFVDFSAVTGYSNDYATLLAIQAKKAEAFVSQLETLIVYYAPTTQAREVAHLAARSWDDVGGVAAAVQTSMEDALAVLGLSDSALAEELRRSA